LPDVGPRQQIDHILQARPAFIDEIFAFAGAVSPAGDGDLAEVQGKFASGVVQGQDDLGHAYRRPVGASQEDNILYFLGP